MKAIDVLKPGEAALVLFTRGALFTMNPDKSGESGNWRLDPRRSPDRIVIYHRGGSVDSNEVFVASFAGSRPSKEPGRSIVMLSNIALAGTTSLNWRRFADASSNPIRYLERPTR